MAKVCQQAPACVLRSSAAGTQPSRRLGAVCKVHAKTAKQQESRFFSFGNESSAATSQGHTIDPFERMVPLEETKGTSAPKLNLFEVHDSRTRRTLNHLFYAAEETEDVHSSCIKLAGVGVVCGSEEYLLTHTQGCIHAGGMYFSTPDSAPTESIDVTEQAWEIL